MVAVQDEWNPAHQDQLDFKILFQKALVDGPGEFVKESSNGSSAFILKESGFHDLQAYVISGSEFSRSDFDFGRRYPKSAAQVLEAVDHGIYEFTQSSVISMARNCHDFKTDGLNQLVTSANGTISFADDALDQLKYNGQSSLLAQFKILLDEKYLEGPKDTAFTDAQTMANLAIDQMINTAADTGKDIGSVLNVLSNFMMRTDEDKKNLQILRKQFCDGPIDRDTNERLRDGHGKLVQPFTKLMDAEVLRLQEEIEQEIKRMKYESDVMDKTTGTFFLGAEGDLFGVINDLYTYDLAKKKYDEMMALETKHKQEKVELRRLITVVRVLLLQIDLLVPQMVKALEAMEYLHSLFNSQELNFRRLKTKLNALNAGVKTNEYNPRRMWINGNLKYAVNKFEEIKKTASEFQQSAKLVVVKDA
ncbi:uncharacterized protein PGRI_053890 [Penicillium griseofulvum]|uniref:Uncharacterized protein n=1 Tax=Penicillium patulum TaxID=5078 RepID=A0A135LC45_PENPA|nr:uncharacterized protein PGRI_053890 [Penicillium griseofulvum]KXG46533.1 hypothetical protein PGRI_053890 [Penicillium griseofulvum]